MYAILINSLEHIMIGWPYNGRWQSIDLEKTRYYDAQKAPIQPI